MKSVHKYAAIFPPLGEEEFAELCSDIKAHGLRNPIVLHQDQILDGINRAKACEKVGVPPVYTPFQGRDPKAFVISQNIHRRHLTPSQKAVILGLDLEAQYAREPKDKGGYHKKFPKEPTVSKAAARRVKEARSSANRAAKDLGLGSGMIRDAKRVRKYCPEYLDDIRNGKMSLNEAIVLWGSRETLERKKRDAKHEYLQTHNRQVADFLDACTYFALALKTALQVPERFTAPEAQSFIKRRLAIIERDITLLRGGLTNDKS